MVLALKRARTCRGQASRHFDEMLPNGKIELSVPGRHPAVGFQGGAPIAPMAILAAAKS